MKRPRPWREWTLRSRLVLAIAVLAGLGLLAANAAGVYLLRSYLVDQVDRELGRQVRGLARVPWMVEPGALRPGGAPAGFGPQNVSRIYTTDGLAASSTTEDETDLGTFAELRDHADAGAYTVRSVDGVWRVEVVSLDPDLGYAVVGVSLAPTEATQTRLIVIDAAVMALILIGIGVAAAAVVRVGLRPLTRMEVAATEIAAGDLSRRVEDADPHTESGRLGTALNSMLVRIETAMAARMASEERLRQFLADAAHELRTPLTSIQGFAELYRRGGARPGPELDEAMGAIESEVGRMRLLVNDLLLLARLDEERTLDRRPVDLLGVAADTVRDAHLRAPHRFVLLDPLDGDSETFDPVTVLGDDARLRQVATNLVSNALQHTPDTAEVVVRVGRGPAEPSTRPVAVAGADLPAGRPVVVLEVADTGPGMAPDEAARAFERLYRAESSRSRRLGGGGLGLSIVAAIVEAHGGRCELFTAPGQGARFRVLLPAGDSQVSLSRDGAGCEEPPTDSAACGYDGARRSRGNDDPTSWSIPASASSP